MSRLLFSTQLRQTGTGAFQLSKSAIKAVQMSRHNHFYDPFLVFLELASFLMNYDEVTKYYCVENSFSYVLPRTKKVIWVWNDMTLLSLFTHFFFLLQSSYYLYGLYVMLEQRSFLNQFLW